MALRRSIFRLISTTKTSNGLCKVRYYSSQADTQTEGEKKKTHFGFETVDEDEKTKKVHKVFETVADKYDLMNDVMSFGVHRLWKDMFMMMLAPTPGTKLLDMAGGTGDIAFRYINYLKNQAGPNDVRSSVTISDINQSMLDVGKIRAERLGYMKDSMVDIDWVCADAEKLPLPDDSYNAYTIAFGIRNCTHIDKVLEEAYRVLRPGGRFLCLEFSQLTNGALQWLYDQYSFQVIPVMGQIVAGQWQPYQYLVESIRQFPDQSWHAHTHTHASHTQLSHTVYNEAKLEGRNRLARSWECMLLQKIKIIPRDPTISGPGRVPSPSIRSGPRSPLATSVLSYPLTPPSQASIESNPQRMKQKKILLIITINTRLYIQRPLPVLTTID
ncbi:unnamed protein product [Danaus chrysippus]|uniref:2-methoxy-6-polyprenyl-1,4-benzoquinol methylase, mitochondrial n=1 Tax=Danaus chrysippus TaxID=151541 RepID=A0A8J2Q5U6_9NEOP|nr:unnamed protein product [Danaus chrysippus]